MNQAIPRFQLPDPEPVEDEIPLDVTYRWRKQRQGFKYKCPKCGKLSKCINMPCPERGATVERW